MNLTILAVHWSVFLAVVYLCRWWKGLANSNLAVALGLICVPIHSFVTLVLLDFGNHAGNGTTGDWFLIFSVVTLGTLPIVTLASAVVSGICAMRFLRYFRGRNSGHTLPNSLAATE